MLSRSLRKLLGEAASAGSLQSVYQTALSCVQDACSVERASILVFDADGVMRFVAWSSLSTEYRAAVEGHSPWSPSETNATPVVVPDVLSDAALKDYLPTLRREGIRALAFIPLRLGTKLLGKFMLYRDEPHEFTEDEIVTAEQIADHVAFALEHHRVSVELRERLGAERVLRQQAETAAALLRESEHRLRSALAAGRMGTWDWDIATNAVSWSEELEALHGLEPGSFAGTLDAFRRDVHPEDAARLDAKIASALGGEEEEYYCEYRLRRRDGETPWVAGHGRLIRDANGKPTRMVGVCADITERKIAEERADRAHWRLESLARVSDRLATALDPQQALRALAEHVVPAFADFCITYAADERAIHHLGFAHRDSAKTALVEALAHAGPVSIEDPWGPGQVVRTGQPCLTSEFSIEIA